MKNLERYFIDQEEEISILKDVDDNWNTDMVLAIERAAIKYNCKNRQVLRMLPLDKLVDYFIYSKIIPNIKSMILLKSILTIIGLIAVVVSKKVKVFLYD